MNNRETPVVEVREPTWFIVWLLLVCIAALNSLFLFPVGEHS